MFLVSIEKKKIQISNFNGEVLRKESRAVPLHGKATLITYFGLPHWNFNQGGVVA